MAKKMVRPSEAAVDNHTLDMFELEAQTFAQQAVEVSDAQKVERANEVVATEKRIVEASKIFDLAERGKELSNEVQFADIKKVRMGDMFIAIPEDTWTNRRIVLDYLFRGAEDKPHFDEFRGRIVDHKGVIVDDFYDGTDYVDAFNAVGLRKLEAKKVIEAVRDFALRRRQNDLTLRIAKMIPEWDGVRRMDSALINMFESHDTPLNRAFGDYFWLSLLCRLLRPGEEAPIVLTLIGVQNCGKSYFGKLLARLLTGDKEADSVQLDLGSNKIDFLREITGQSVIASVGEMTGFNRGDLSKIKDFVTRTHDKFHYKFEGVVHQARQWITIMDANNYEGLLRDDSGNRRFYPMFCGQLPDVAGKQQWRKDFKADFDGLKGGDLWQLLAEAKHWVESNGVDAYRDFVRDVSKQVFDFSANEAANDRGTIADDVFDTYLLEMLKQFPGKHLWKFKIGGKTAVRITTTDFKRFFMDAKPNLKVNWRHLKNKMNALGAQEHTDSKGYSGYVFPAIHDLKTFDDVLGVKLYDADGEAEMPSSNSGKVAARGAGF
jgi:hypothetical protein